MYKDILRDTFASVFEEKDALFKALLIPTILTIILEYFLTTESKNFFILIPTFILLFAINITIAISTHRIVLLQNNNIPSWGLFTFKAREYNFAFSTLKLSLICTLLILLTTMVIFFFSWILNFIIDITKVQDMFIFGGLGIAFLLTLLVAARLSLVFPSLAVDKKLSFNQIWQDTNKYTLLCLITVIVFPVLFGLIFGFAYGFVIDLLVKFISSHLNILNSVLNVLINVFTISALSHTYKYVIINNIEMESNTRNDFDEDNNNDIDSETFLETLNNQEKR